MPTESDTDRPLVAVAVLASFVAFLDGSVVNLALPAIGREFGENAGDYSWRIAKGELEMYDSPIPL